MRVDERPEINRQFDAQQQEIEKLNELVFAYESVNAPVNPLVAENKIQAEEIEGLKKTLAYERRLDSSVRDQNARNFAKNKILTSENQALVERIEKLEGLLKEAELYVSRDFVSDDIGPQSLPCRIEQALKGKKIG